MARQRSHSIPDWRRHKYQHIAMDTSYLIKNESRSNWIPCWSSTEEKCKLPKVDHHISSRPQKKQPKHALWGQQSRGGWYTDGLLSSSCIHSGVLKQGWSSSVQILASWFLLLHTATSSAETLPYRWSRLFWKLGQSGVHLDEKRQQHYMYSTHFTGQTMLGDFLDLAKRSGFNSTWRLMGKSYQQWWNWQMKVT